MLISKGFPKDSIKNLIDINRVPKDLAKFQLISEGFGKEFN